MKKRYISAVLLVASFFIISASSYDAPPQQHEGFKNLKILPKDIPHEKLDSIMGVYSVSLGVRCNFCHAMSKDTTNHHPDFASDDKQEKEIARHMMKMTAEINETNFNWTHTTQPDTLHSVVCYTCHRGTKSPNSDAFISLIDSTIQSHRRR